MMEKYILNETLLNKKFILTEDSNSTSEQSPTKILNSSMSNIRAVDNLINKYSKKLKDISNLMNIWNKINLQFEKIKSQISKTDSFENINNELTLYFNLWNNFIDLKKLTNNEINNILSKIRVTIAPNNYKNKVNRYKNLNKLISLLHSKLLNLSKISIGDSPENVLAKLKKLANINVSSQEDDEAKIHLFLNSIESAKNSGMNLKALQLDNTVLTISELNNNIEASLKNIYQNPNTLDISFLFENKIKIEKVLEQLTNINKLNEIKSGIISEVIDKNNEINQATDKANSLKINNLVDWSDAFMLISKGISPGNLPGGGAKGAKLELNREDATTQLWNIYYSKEWAPEERAIKVKNLGYTFKQELLVLGFSNTTNPFIPYIQNMIDEANLTNKTYAAINNAYIFKYISNKDLRGIDSLTGKVNLIFNLDLFEKSPSEILSYLNLQADIINRYKNGTISKYFTSKTLEKEYGSDCKKFLIEVFGTKGNPLKFTDSTTEDTVNNNPSAVNDKETTMKNLKLKSIEKIKIIIEACFGESGIKANWENSMANNIIQILRTKGNVINALKYLVSAYGANYNEIKKYKEVIENGDNYDIKLSSKFVPLFNSYSINPQNISQIINDIATAAGLTPIK